MTAGCFVYYFMVSGVVGRVRLSSGVLYDGLWVLYRVSRVVLGLA